MDWIMDLFMGEGVAHSLFVLSLTIAAGNLLARVRIRGISLGVTWILFAGLLLGHLGCGLESDVAHFAKELGLVLFVYAIGLRAGGAFFTSFRNGGIRLNLLALACILLADGLCVALSFLTGENPLALIGVLYGAVTNTPGLGTAQQTYADLHGGLAPTLFSSGYAVAYPLAVVGIIGAVILFRFLYQRHEVPQRITPLSKPLTVRRGFRTDIMTLFLGIAAGLALGSIPLRLPGMAVPVKIGLAGGPLIVALLISAFGRGWHLDPRMTKEANDLMREIGISLFLAVVGIEAGHGFVGILLDGGYRWVAYGFLMTTLPVFIIGWMAQRLFHIDYFILCGLIAGALTDPPALSYANSICPDERVGISYSTVYPLSMLLRIVSAQLLVLMATNMGQ